MSGRWADWPPARPIRVDGGIRARSKRGAIGEQWWSRRFISVLESYGMSGRLARGRSYARAGQVLDFELSQGKVTARVQGSRVRPYQVRIGVLPLTTAQWRRVQDRLASQALFRAKLLAGEMPREIEEVFAECGTPLFPRSPADLDMHCSCPDWEVPCKHLAAVCYVLAEEFDRDPFGMLAWRGKARDELLAALRRIQAAGTGPGQDASAAAPAWPNRGRLDVPGPALEDCLGGFWSSGLSPARLRALASAPEAAAPGLLLRMFPPPPVTVRGQDLADVLASAYERLAADDLPGP
ncbi:MAG TPA: SWIM zinc finger family protein [Streptosporangiaceae bacterium]|nr:SWIM zinc finger family protein [Streptosporangiaceae bacterium]